MAVAICVQTILVIFCLIISVQNVHSKARYHLQPKMIDVSRKSLVPTRFEEYQNCSNGICLSATDYPEKEILHIMQNTKEYIGIFGTALNASYQTTTIDSRSGYIDTKAKELCDAPPQTLTPRVLRNVTNNWKFIVNVEGYYQRFQVEVCRNDPSTESNDRCVNMFGFKCGQSYQEIFLLVFEEGRVDLDRFFIPTTCNCNCKETFSSKGLK